MKRKTASIERSDNIAILHLDKPPVNALDLTLVADVETCLKSVEHDPAVRAVVITGKGKCFSAGLDLKTIPYYTPAEQRRLVEDLNRTVAWIYGFPLPTVAAINNHAIAGGFILAIICDYRVGTSGSGKLGVTEVKVGIPFPFSTMEVLRSELTPATARQMTLVGRTVGPEQALAQGVIDEIRPAQEVLSRAIEVARDFAGLPKEAYTRIKRQLRGEAIARMEEVIRTGSDPLLQTWITEEGRLASARQLGR